jgi:hypothetical protein
VAAWLGVLLEEDLGGYGLLVEVGSLCSCSLQNRVGGVEGVGVSQAECLTLFSGMRRFLRWNRIVA